MTYPLLQRELTVHLNNGHWHLRPVEDNEILGPVDFGWKRYQLYPDSFTFGEGLLAGSSIPGSRRLVFCAWSPQWETFYVSSMGGAAYTFHGVGVNYVALRGRAMETSVIIMNHKNGEIDVRLEPLNVEPIWSQYASPDGEPLMGFYALQQALYDRYAGEFSPGKVRIFAVGPAALHTREGAIGSSPIKKGIIQPVDDWAGRGGLGSRLLQYHNIAGCVFGGEWEDPDLRDSSEIDSYFLAHFGKKTIQADLGLTKKYRYVPEFETGGTFGVNMKTMGRGILSFNYRSIYAPETEREQQHQNFILAHYLKQFNAETIKGKQFHHCGEPCPVACKKLNGIYKKDYEPYHALGPQVGVFDQRAAEKLNHYADAMGFDAINLGGTLAWIMELVAENLIPAEDFGFPAASEMHYPSEFVSDTKNFDLVADSQRNTDYAIALMDALLFKPECHIFRQGIRFAAHELDKQYGINSINRAVFLSSGDSGYMIPNQYKVPGMLSPMPLMGKYFVYYGQDYFPPAELGRKNVERMVYEFFNENTGICRFHRKWAELIADDIVMAHYNLKVDYKAHQFQLVQAIFNRESAKATPWESLRVADMILAFLEQWKADGLNDPDLEHWLTEFKTDKTNAARAYWQEILRGIREAFQAGAEAIPDMLSPGQAGRDIITSEPGGF